VASETRVGFIVRSFRRSPLFFFPSLLVLGLTAGATLAIVALLRGVLFTDLDLPRPDRLVSLCERHEQLGGWCAISTPATAELGRSARSVQAAGVGRTWSFTLEADGTTDNVGGGLLGPGFLEALGVSPILGRGPTEAEMGEEAGRVLVLSHELWATRFGSDPDAVGRSVRVDGETHTVIGVLPAGFAVPDIPGARLWRPLHFSPDDADRRGWRGFVGVARLADGVTLSRARNELEGIYEQLGEQFEEIDDEWRFDMIPLNDRVVGGVRSQLWLFAVAVALFTFIGAANVLNLFLFRSLRARHDDAIREALGAPAGDRLRRGAGEGLVLGVLASVVGLALGFALLRAILALAPPGLPRLEEVTIEPVGVLITVLLTAGLGVLSAVLAGRVVSGGVRATTRKGTTRWTSRVRSGLVSLETALAVILLASAGVLGRSFLDYASWDPGFPTGGLISAQVFANTAEFRTVSDVAAAWPDLERATRGLAGVRTVATASSGPLFGGEETDTYGVSGEPEGGVVRWYDVSPGYFGALDRTVLAGRELRDSDASGTERVAVVNATLAGRHGGPQAVLGREVRVQDMDLAFRIVGVVADVPVLEPGRPVPAEIFWSNRQLPRWGSFLVVRLEPGVGPGSVATALEALEPRFDVGSLRPLEERLRAALVRPRFMLFLVGVFAGLAAILAAGGLFAVLGVSVAERMSELGIRLALGAGRERVTRMILGNGMRLATVGIVFGLLVHWVTERLLVSSVPGVRGGGWLPLILAAALPLLIALLAALPPARKAGRADPLSLLRDAT